MITVVLAANAFAASTATCDRQPIAEQALALAGASAFAVRGMEAAVTLFPSTDATVHVSGTACSEAGIKLGRRDGVIVATARVPRDGGLELTVAVPADLASVTFYEHTGSVRADGVPARLAIVSSVGPVDVHGARSLRVAYGAGPVTVDGLQGDLVVERRDGPLSARAITGDVLADEVGGPVSVDDVSGDLAVKGGGGPVSQQNVRGVITLP